jgi:AraC-like DNA-binding protein
VSIRICIDDVAPAARLERFRDALASAIVPTEVRVQADGPLRGASISAGRVGSVAVTKVSVPPGARLRFEARRTTELIRRSDAGAFLLHAQVRGRATVSQDGNEAVVGPGDVALVDLSRPSRLLHVGDEHEFVAVLLPHDAAPLRGLPCVTAIRVPGSDGLGAAVSALARHLTQCLGDRGATDGMRLSVASLDLLILALAERLDRPDAVSAVMRRRALLASVQAFIERRLADPRLSPMAIAAAHHVSLRSLHKLFEDHGSSVGRWIRERRLERCRRDLLDPALSDLPASAIALGWGFSTAAHFSRVFRDAYGHPPGEYRRRGRGLPALLEHAHHHPAPLQRDRAA